MRFSLPFFHKRQKKQVYFCLYLTDSFLNGFIVDLATGKPIILAHKKNHVTSDLPEKVLEDTDTLISELELQANVQLDKTIFFLHSYMIDPSTHEIKDSYKVTIKSLVKDLELEPLGYIDLQEALSEHVKEKSIINSIFVEINKKELGIFIYKGGSLIHFEYTSRSENVAEDVQSVLSAIPGKQILPTKIFLYGDIRGDQLASEIASFKWEEKTFIQHPTIDVVKDPEMNGLLADSFSKELLSNEATEVQEESTEKSETNSFGFVFGSEVSADARPAPDISGSPTVRSNHKNNSSFQVGLKSFFNKFPLSGISLKKNKFPLVIPIIVLLALVLSFVLYEYFFHKTLITVYPESKSFTDQIKLDLPIEDSQPSDSLVLLQHTKVTDYTQEKSTTGSRDIGEKAKGEVTVHNFDNSEKSFDKGTKLVYKDLVFLTNSDIKVASSSGVTSDGTKQSGKAKVAVTASEIGDTYNIAKNSQLKIDGLSDSLYLAIVDDTFTGGSKKKVRTVAKNDMDELETAAEKEAKKKSNQLIAKDLTKEEVLLSELTEVKLAEATFSKELGEEADKVSIKASAEMDYFTVDKNILNNTIQKNVTKSDANDYQLDPKTLDIRVRDVEKDNKQASLTVDADATLYKKISSDAIKNALKGKTASVISSLTEGEFNIKEAEMTSTFPPIPFLNGWLPFFEKNITIEVATK